MAKSPQKVALITTPSLNQSFNVSGVSSVVRGIIDSCRGGEWAFQPVIIGKSDNRRRGIVWALDQLSVPFRFLGAVMHCRPRLIHINGPLSSLAILRDAVLLVLARFYSRNVVYHLHGGLYVSTKPRSRLLEQIISGMLSLPGLVLVLGEQEAESITRLYGANKARVRVLPNAVTMPQTVQKRERQGPLKVLSLGRISPEKGIDVLCAAFEQDPYLRSDVILHMYGAGPLEDELVPRLEITLGSSFHFGGVAHEAERDAAYAWADVIVVPSRYGEGLPMALLEAMAAGVVPIATADGMITNVVSHGETGYIIEKNSPTALRDALKIALQAKEGGALKSVSSRTREIVSRRHSMRSYARTLERYYRDVQS